MYEPKVLSIDPILPATAGVVILPFAGDNPVLFTIAVTSITIGALIVLSTVARLIAKKIYKA